MPRSIDLGRALLALGAALLLASLFVEWYDDGLTAWEVFEALDLLLLALALAAAALALRPGALGPSRSSLAPVAIPAVVLVVVVVQLLNPPPAAAGADPSTGAWLALGAAVLMLAGAALAVARIAVTVEVGERRIRHRTPAVDRRAPDEPGATGAAAPATADDPLPTDAESAERTQSLRVIADDDEEPDRS
jgi:hypothetical protein